MGSVNEVTPATNLLGYLLDPTIDSVQHRVCEVYSVM